MDADRPPSWYAPPGEPVRQDGRMDLVEFLRARLDEDEKAAKRVHQPYRLYACDDGHVEEPMRVDGLYDENEGEYQQWEPGEDRLPNHHNSWALIYDPARVLAEVEAKRQRIADYLKICELADPVRHPDQAYVLAKGAMERTFMLDALPYADHPEYDEAWRP